MVKKCIYCKTELADDSVVDVCRRCGIGVWGEKMFNAIIENMEGAKTKGDLYQGSVSYSPDKKPAPKKSALGSIAQEALATQAAKPVERQLDAYPQKKASSFDSPNNAPISDDEDSASFLVNNSRRF